MNAVGPTLLPTDPLAQAIRYCKNRRAALLRFIDDAALPIDNSPTERLFQNVAKLRLNMLFAGSTKGAHRACVLLGSTATCRAIGVPALVYLTWAFERLGTHRDLYGIDAADLTPAAFKQQASVIAPELQLGDPPHPTTMVEAARLRITASLIGHGAAYESGTAPVTPAPHVLTQAPSGEVPRGRQPPRRGRPGPAW